MATASPSKVKTEDPKGQDPSGLLDRFRTAIQQMLNTVFTGGIDHLLTFGLDDKQNVVGQFVENRQPYDFSISPQGNVKYVESKEDSGRSDSYWDAFYRVRGDAKQRNCSQGKPCGDTCIQKGIMCQKALDGAAKAAFGKMHSAMMQYRQEGGTFPWKKTAIVAGLVAGGATLGIAASRAGQPKRQTPDEPPHVPATPAPPKAKPGVKAKAGTTQPKQGGTTPQKKQGAIAQKTAEPNAESENKTSELQKAETPKQKPTTQASSRTRSRTAPRTASKRSAATSVPNAQNKAEAGESAEESTQTEQKPASTRQRRQTKRDSEPNQRQFLLLLRQILTRSYTDGIDQFVQLDVTPAGMISGVFRDGEKLIEFSIGDVIKTKQIDRLPDRADSALIRYSQSLIQAVRGDAKSSKPKCVKGLSCKGSCISRDKTCEVKLSRVASPIEIASLRQLGSLSLPKPPAEPQTADPKPDPLDEMSIRQLKEEAKSRRVYRYSEMNSSQLKEAIRLADRDPDQQRRLGKTLKRARSTPVNLRPFRLKEKNKSEKALIDSVKKWNRLVRISQLAGVDPSLAGAAVVAVSMGITMQTYNRLRERYREGLNDSAKAAIERASKKQVPYVQRGNITFAVGGFRGEGSSGRKIQDALEALGKNKDASKADTWFSTSHHFVVYDNREFDVKPSKQSKRKSNGDYNPLYLADVSNRAFGAYFRNFRRGRNEAAVELAAQIYAYANRRNTKNSALYAHKDKTINVIAHATGGNTAYEAMEILARMNPPRSRPGREVLAQVNLVTLGTTDFGYTDRGLVRERNITSALDPFSFLPQRNEKWVSTVKGHEVQDYMRDPEVMDEIRQATGYYSYTNYQREMEVRKKRQPERDDSLRLDKKPECKIGKSCGNACIPPDAECKPKSNPKAEIALKVGAAIGTKVIIGAAAGRAVAGLSTPSSKERLTPDEEALTESTGQFMRSLFKDPEIRALIVKKPETRGQLMVLSKDLASYGVHEGIRRVKRTLGLPIERKS